MSPELQGLTGKQQKTVILAALPEIEGNISEVARRRGVSRQTVAETLQNPAVANAIERRKARHLDKARGSLAKIQRAERKLLSKLEDIADTDLTPAEIGGLVKISLEARKLLTDMGVESETPSPDHALKVIARVKLAAMRVGWDMRDRGEERP